MSKRRELLIALGTGMLAAPFASLGQQARIPRIGLLQSGLSANDSELETFKQRLRELGHVDGKTIAIDYRSAETKYERLPGLAAELVRRNVDIILTVGGTNSALAAKNATQTIPIVFVGVADPQGQGIVASLARPGGNITGMSNQHPETAAKTLQLLMEIVPSATRIVILSNPTNPSLPPVIKDMEVAAKRLRVQISTVYAHTPAEFANAFDEAARLRADSLAIVRDSMLNVSAKALAELAAKHRLPAISGISLYPESGGLISYGANLLDSYRRAAALVDKILKGARPADLPVEQPTKFDLVVNLKTAKALGITIPQTVLVWADKIIQ